MALPIITPGRKFLSILCTFWIPIKSYRKALRGILQLGIRRYINTINQDKKKQFKYDLSIVAVMKNESPYLKEWLDFHILAGVQKFYLYDNESTDDTRKILKPYIQSGIVDYTFWPGKYQQRAVYIDAINRHSNDTRWMAVIDLDEFIVPTQCDTITEFLYTLPRNFGALVLSWVMYGSSGHITRPQGLVIENYKYYGHSGRASGCKSIINPRLCVEHRNPHINFFAGFLIDENGRKLGRINQTFNPPSHQKIRCNHYVTKSFEEYRERCNKGSVAYANNLSKVWSRAGFEKRDTNDLTDNVMDRWIVKLKKFQNLG